MKAKQAPESRKTGYQVVEEKLQAANAYLKTADLSLVYETMAKNRGTKQQP
jgi:hypothetical protein